MLCVYVLVCYTWVMDALILIALIHWAMVWAWGVELVRVPETGLLGLEKKGLSVAGGVKTCDPCETRCKSFNQM